ncbi:MAG: hypothetical protein ACKOF9_04040 [Burkholderiales bacterium]
MIFLVACSQMPEKNPDSNSFQVCESEAFMSLSVARQYIASGKDRSSVLPYVGETLDNKTLAEEVFRRVDAGQIRHHATFATEKLYECASREGAALTVPPKEAELCFAKVDIPFLLFLAKENGLSKADAIARVGQQTRNQGQVPSALVSSVAERVYPSSTVEQTNRTMRALFWSCMYP